MFTTSLHFKILACNNEQLPLLFITACHFNKIKALRHDLYPAVFILTGGKGKWGISQPQKHHKGIFWSLVSS